MKMKKFSRKIISALLAICIFSGMTVAAAFDQKQTVVVKFNGQSLEFRTPAYAANETVMLPLRDTAEKLGCTVKWVETVNSAVLIYDSKEIAVVTLYKNEYTCRGKIYSSAECPILIGGNTYISSDMIETIFNTVCRYASDTNILYIGESNQDVQNSDEGKLIIPTFEDTYVQAGKTADTNFGSDTTLDFKAGAGDTNRLIYLKFDISKLSSDLSAAYIIFTGISAENRSAEVSFNIYESDPTSWSEDTLTFNTQPNPGKLVGSESIIFSTTMRMDLTNYVIECIKKNKGTLAIVLDGDYHAPLRMTFASSDNSSSQGPMLHIDYGSSIQKNLPSKDGFGQGQNPWHWAQKMWDESQFHKTSEDDCEQEKRILAQESSFVTCGIYKNTNYGNEIILDTKSDVATTNTGKIAYIKFPLRGLSLDNFDSAAISVYCVSIDGSNAHAETLSTTDFSWKESTLTWANKPKNKECVSQAIASPNSWTTFDVTNAIKKALKNGDEYLSVAMEDTEKLRTSFASSRHKNAPYMTLYYYSPDDSDRINIPQDDYSEYKLTTLAKRDGNTSQYISYPTRLIDTLQGYKISTKEPSVSAFGGRLDITYDATGFYYTKEINGRWWIIDPEGHPMINAAVVNVHSGSTKAEIEGRTAQYGTDAEWAEKTTDLLRNNLYFNGFGAWSNNTLLDAVQKPLANAKLFYFLRSYMQKMNLFVSGSGSTNFANGTFNVFDPDFDTFCDEFAQLNCTPLKNNANLLGYMSDNELPGSFNMLDILLNLDTSDPLNAYTYAAAWTFVRNYTGKEEPVFSDITDTMREDFRDFVYDRYFNVISKAIKKADPNHMYLGCRFHEPSINSRGIWSAAGRYCDIVTTNYYKAWTPDSVQMRNWYRWSKKPFIATEWYAMAYDSGLNCSSGAGFRTDRQSDRGNFYQNFTLKMLETKSCVGFHWFQYLDNDPTATGRDSSNVDGNKGIVTTKFKMYTALTDEMAELNKNLYPLIDFFDKRSSNY